LITNDKNNNTFVQTTLPFGTLVPIKSNDFVNPVFTTYERLTSGIDYAINRHYNSQELFLQPDPAGMAAADLTTPQSLNLYSYVGNDPTNTVDPAGLQAWRTPGTWTSIALAGTALVVTAFAAPVVLPVAMVAGFVGGVAIGFGGTMAYASMTSTSTTQSVSTNVDPYTGAMTITTTITTTDNAGNQTSTTQTVVGLDLTVGSTPSEASTTDTTATTTDTAATSTDTESTSDTGGGCGPRVGNPCPE
jgi:RHS repeat-associated protein